MRQNTRQTGTDNCCALCRLALLCCLVLRPGAGSGFLQWARRHHRRYSSLSQLLGRRTVFTENRRELELHNAEFAAGRVSFARKAGI